MTIIDTILKAFAIGIAVTAACAGVVIIGFITSAAFGPWGVGALVVFVVASFVAFNVIRES